MLKFLWDVLLWNLHLIDRDEFVKRQREYARAQHLRALSWRLSGFTKDNQDAGVIDIGCMSRAKALDRCAKLFPRSTIIDVDDQHHIITYRNNE